MTNKLIMPWLNLQCVSKKCRGPHQEDSSIVLNKVIILFCFFATFSAEASAPCPEKTSEGCASSFAHVMTNLIKKVRTGRGPFALAEVTSSGNNVTMTYKGDFTPQQLTDVLKSRGQTRENFLDHTHTDFTNYQCDGPIRELLIRGVHVHNDLAFRDGSELDSFELSQCP